MVRLCWVNFQCRGVLLIWIRVGQGRTELAVGPGRDCSYTFVSRVSFLFFLPLQETARYTVGAVGVVWTFFSLINHFSLLSPSLFGRRPDKD